MQPVWLRHHQQGDGRTHHGGKGQEIQGNVDTGMQGSVEHQSYDQCDRTPSKSIGHLESDRELVNESGLAPPTITDSYHDYEAEGRAIDVGVHGLMSFHGPGKDNQSDHRGQHGAYAKCQDDGMAILEEVLGHLQFKHIRVRVLQTDGLQNQRCRST